MIGEYSRMLIEILDFLRSLLENAGYMLGYGKGAVAKDFVPDAKTVSLLLIAKDQGRLERYGRKKADRAPRTSIASSNESAKTSSAYAPKAPRNLCLISYPNALRTLPVGIMPRVL